MGITVVFQQKKIKISVNKSFLIWQCETILFILFKYFINLNFNSYAKGFKTKTLKQILGL